MTMTDIRLGNLSLGQIPRVAGTISTSDALPLSAGVHNYICDIVEVRLDHLERQEVAWLDNCLLLEQQNFPVILTLRLQTHGGKWRKGDGAREAILSTALSRLATIDIEFDSELVPKLCKMAEAEAKPIIISYHNFEGTPKLEELREIVSRASEYPRAIPKVATMVLDENDIGTLKRLLETKSSGQPLCLIGMGALAARTRLEFPLMGSCLAYGYIDAPVAPGQWPSHRLVQCLRESMPECI